MKGKEERIECRVSWPMFMTRVSSIYVRNRQDHEFIQLNQRYKNITYLIEIQRNILRVRWDGTILKNYSSHVGWDYPQKMFLD
jgi:hypothetical protein